MNFPSLKTARILNDAEMLSIKGGDAPCKSGCQPGCKSGCKPGNKNTTVIVVSP